MKGEGRRALEHMEGMSNHLYVDSGLINSEEEILMVESQVVQQTTGGKVSALSSGLQSQPCSPLAEWH